MLVSLGARAEVFLRVFIERSLAAERAEVVGRALVLGLSRRCGRIDIHAAHDIVYSVLHLGSFSSTLCFLRLFGSSAKQRVPA